MTATDKIVARTLTPPKMIMANLEFLKPLLKKIVSALNMMALMPENCWKKFNPTAMTKGT